MLQLLTQQLVLRFEPCQLVNRRPADVDIRFSQSHGPAGIPYGETCLGGPFFTQVDLVIAGKKSGAVFDG